MYEDYPILWFTFNVHCSCGNHWLLHGTDVNNGVTEKCQNCGAIIDVEWNIKAEQRPKWKKTPFEEDN